MSQEPPSQQDFETPRPGQPPEDQKNSAGTWGFVLSILGLFTCFILSPFGLIFSLIGLKKHPKNMAIAGVIISTASLFLLLPIAGLLAAIAVPSFLRAREISERNACQENLAKIDGAKQQWALEYNQDVDAVPAWADLVGNSKYLRTTPACPGEGDYTINPVGENPECSLKDQQSFPHTFPQPRGTSGY